jgi:hypothetical protein
MSNKSERLNGIIIKLHDIARDIEQLIGIGSLSITIRKAADTLSLMLKKVA